MKGIDIGKDNDVQEIKKNCQKYKIFTATIYINKREELIEGWKNAVSRVKSNV